MFSQLLNMFMPDLTDLKTVLTSLFILVSVISLLWSGIRINMTSDDNEKKKRVIVFKSVIWSIPIVGLCMLMAPILWGRFT